MKASELIEYLSRQINEHGDIDIVLSNYITTYDDFTHDNIGILETKHSCWPRVYRIIIDTKEKLVW